MRQIRASFESHEQGTQDIFSVDSVQVTARRSVNDGQYEILSDMVKGSAHHTGETLESAVSADGAVIMRGQNGCATLVMMESTLNQWIRDMTRKR